MWATQGKNNDIEFGAHFLTGLVYFSIHESGEVPYLLQKRIIRNDMLYHRNIPWKLSTFNGIQLLTSNGMSKDILKKLPNLKNAREKNI